ncbi:MAG: T9SS type A sorting domain-containing protein [Candidatus Kapaibacterium sp.]
MKNFTRFFWTLAVILLVTVRLGYSQPWSYDFGSTTGSFSTPSGTSTTFLPTPTSGTSFVRIGTGTGSINLENSGTGIQKIGSGVRLRLEAATNTSVNKASIYNYTGGKSFYTKFSILFGNSSGSTLAASSIIIFAQGDGTTYSDGNAFSGSQCFTQLQFQIAASGAITTTARVASSPTSFGATIVQGNVYTFEIFGNNTTGTISYTYNGASQTVAANKQDIWINGTIVGNDIGKATLASDVNIDSWMIYGINSASNSQNVFFDDVTYSNSIASSYTTNTDYYSKSSGNLETNTNWTTNNDGTGTITPSNFTTGYRFFNIRNNSAPTIGADWTVSGTDSKVILGDGTNGCTFTIPSSYSVTGTVDVSNNGTLKLQNTTLPNFGTLSSGSTVEYNQGSPATATGTTYSNLTINNSAGVTLSSNITVNGIFNLANGKLNTSAANKLTLGTTASITGGSLTSFVNGPLDLMTDAAVLKTVHVGYGSDYRSIGLEPENITPTTFTVEFKNGGFNVGNLTPPLVKVSQNDYLDIQRPAGANAKITIGWKSNVGISSLADLKLAHWNTGTLKWEEVGTVTYTGTATDGTMSTNEYMSSFSPFAFGSEIDQPLPVTLSSFNSSQTGRNVSIYWITSSEQNNSGFEVQRALVDNTGIISDFSKITFVYGNGNSTVQKSYSYTDRNLNTGKYKYRLKQIDYNGNFEYHNLNNIVEIGVPDKYYVSQNYPNPFNPVTKIDFNLPVDSKVSLVIYDVTGKVVAKLLNNEFRSAGYYTAEFDASKFSSGVYFYSFSTDKFNITKRMTLIK